MVAPIPSLPSDSSSPVGYVLVRPSDTIVLSTVADEASWQKPYHIARAETPHLPYCNVPIPHELAWPQSMPALAPHQICPQCLEYCLRPDQQALRPYNRSLYVQGTVIDLEAQREAYRIQSAKEKLAAAFSSFVQMQQTILMQMQHIMQAADIDIDPTILQALLASSITSEPSHDPDAPYQIVDHRLGIVAYLGNEAWLIAQDDEAFQQWRSKHWNKGYIGNLREDRKFMVHYASCGTLTGGEATAHNPKIVSTKLESVEIVGSLLRWNPQRCEKCFTRYVR